MSYKISWPALLQKAEEEISKAEEFYSRDDPMTEIDKVRGTEMAYYEKAEEAVANLEAAMKEEQGGLGMVGEVFGQPRIKCPYCGSHNTELSEDRTSGTCYKCGKTFPVEMKSEEEEGGRVIPTHAKPSEPCPRCGKNLPTNPTERSHHITQHDAETGEYSTPRNPFHPPEETPMREEVDRRHTSPVQGAHDAPPDVDPSQMTPRARDLYTKFPPHDEEAPLDSKAVKSVLSDALTNAASLVEGIEKYLADIEDLDYEDIDSAVEVVNQVLQSLKDAKEMGFPQAGESSPTAPNKAPEVKDKSTPPESPEKGEA